MRKLTLTAAAAALLFAASCNNSSSDTAETGAQQEAAAQTGKEFTVDAASSVIKWKGVHKGGLNPRFGTLTVSGGSLSVENGKVTGGSFDIDLNTLKVDSSSTDNDTAQSNKLSGHLKSPDFFDVAKHPGVKFTITNVRAFDATTDKSLLADANSVVSGNLSIKDSTVNVTFPAKLTIADNGISVLAKFTVDRTSWGLNYKAEGDPANWMIGKDLELDIDLKAVPK